MREVIIDVTNRCSMQCKYCGTNAKPGGSFDIDLSFVTRLLDSSTKGDGTYRFFFGGGNAFRHAHWDELLSMPRKYGAEVTVDCPLEDLTLERLKILSPRQHGYSPSISLWGVGTVHDNLTKPGSFSLLDNFIEEIEKSAPIKLSFVLSTELINQKNEVVAFMQNLPQNSTVYFHRLMPVGRAQNISLPTHAELIDFRSALVGTQRFAFHHTLETSTCPAGKSRIFVDHDGKVYTCGWVGRNSSFAALEADNLLTVDELFLLAVSHQIICPLKELPN